MADDRPALSQEITTLAKLLSLYAIHRTAKKVESERKANERRAKLWVRCRKADKDVSKISLAEWEYFITKRRSGEIDAADEPLEPDKRKEVRDGTICADLVFLLSVINFGCRWREGDRYRRCRHRSCPSSRPRRTAAG